MTDLPDERSRVIPTFCCRSASVAFVANSSTTLEEQAQQGDLQNHFYYRTPLSFVRIIEWIMSASVTLGSSLSKVYKTSRNALLLSVNLQTCSRTSRVLSL